MGWSHFLNLDIQISSLVWKVFCSISLNKLSASFSLLELQWFGYWFFLWFSLAHVSFILFYFIFSLNWVISKFLNSVSLILPSIWSTLVPVFCITCFISLNFSALDIHLIAFLLYVFWVCIIFLNSLNYPVCNFVAHLSFLKTTILNSFPGKS